MGFFGRKVDGKETVVIVEPGGTKWSEKPKRRMNPCPVCGSEHVSMCYVGSGEGGWRGICIDCIYMPQGLCKTEEEAIKQWNGDDEK